MGSNPIGVIYDVAIKQINTKYWKYSPTNYNVNISKEIVFSILTDAVLSMFPSALKLANTTAVHKENLKSSKENYS